MLDKTTRAKEGGESESGRYVNVRDVVMCGQESINWHRIARVTTARSSFVRMGRGWVTEA